MWHRNRERYRRRHSPVTPTLRLLETAREAATHGPRSSPRGAPPRCAAEKPRAGAKTRARDPYLQARRLAGRALRPKLHWRSSQRLNDSPRFPHWHRHTPPVFCAAAGWVPWFHGGVPRHALRGKDKHCYRLPQRAAFLVWHADTRNRKCTKSIHLKLGALFTRRVPPRSKSRWPLR